MSLIDNKRTLLDYEILDRFEAGIELFGYEVKSIRAGLGSLKGARVVVRGGEAYLIGSTIPPFQPKNAPESYDPERNRRLLLNHKELRDIEGAEHEKGLTTIPIAMYNKGRNLKLEIGIAKGKKKADKRATIAERDTKRDIDRTLKIKDR
ncbi:MAG: SsrA-binding protein SsrA-binding protein [Candidatus Kaiserbacteria bacterium]|nr:SsrA-binding protein SsrA-binding protein [Candidatus Kaiserbacteria bacterium]